MSNIILTPPAVTDVPVHIKRNMVTSPALDKDDVQYLNALIQALRVLALHPDFQWVKIVAEVTKDVEFQHLVLPESVYLRHIRILSKCCFEVVPDATQHASRDGLREALLQGSDFNKTQH